MPKKNVKKQNTTVIETEESINPTFSKDALEKLTDIQEFILQHEKTVADDDYQDILESEGVQTRLKKMKENDLAFDKAKTEREKTAQAYFRYKCIIQKAERPDGFIGQQVGKIDLRDKYLKPYSLDDGLAMSQPIGQQPGFEVPGSAVVKLQEEQKMEISRLRDDIFNALCLKMGIEPDVAHKIHINEFMLQKEAERRKNIAKNQVGTNEVKKQN